MSKSKKKGTGERPQPGPIGGSGIKEPEKVGAKGKTEVTGTPPNIKKLPVARNVTRKIEIPVDEEDEKNFRAYKNSLVTEMLSYVANKRQLEKALEEINDSIDVKEKDLNRFVNGLYAKYGVSGKAVEKVEDGKMTIIL